MSGREEKGFTLIEILIVVSVLAGVLWSMESAVQHAATAVARTNDCAREVSGIHRALGFLEPDLRSAEAVESPATGEVRIRREGGEVVYALEGGVLLRRSPEGTQRLARGLSAFTVAREGGLFRVTLDLAVRGTGVRGRAGVTTLVAPRPERGER